jgi:hypothetical protein
VAVAAVGVLAQTELLQDLTVVQAVVLLAGTRERLGAGLELLVKVMPVEQVVAIGTLEAVVELVRLVEIIIAVIQVQALVAMV